MQLLILRLLRYRMLISNSTFQIMRTGLIAMGLTTVVYFALTLEPSLVLVALACLAGDAVACEMTSKQKTARLREMVPVYNDDDVEIRRHQAIKEEPCFAPPIELQIPPGGPGGPGGSGGDSKDRDGAMCKPVSEPASDAKVISRIALELYPTADAPLILLFRSFVRDHETCEGIVKEARRLVQDYASEAPVSDVAVWNSILADCSKLAKHAETLIHKIRDHPDFARQHGMQAASSQTDAMKRTERAARNAEYLAFLNLCCRRY